MSDQRNPGDGNPPGTGPEYGYPPAGSDAAQWPQTEAEGGALGASSDMGRASQSPGEPGGRKRKIDLKERLSSVRAAGTMAGVPSGPGKGEAAVPAFPPPPARGSVPPPKVLSSDGLAPPAAIAALMGIGEEKEEPKPTAQQQTIKVEVGEEILAERRRLHKRMVIYAAAAGVVALAIGFGVGGVKARGDQSKQSIIGAGEIAKQIEESDKVMADLSDALRSASDQLSKEKYPTELADQLKSINVPFSAANLSGRLIAGLPGQDLQGLLQFSRGVEDLNKTKDKLRNLLGAAQKPVEEYVAEKKDPQVRFSVVFSASNAGMMAELAPNKAPFKLGDKWPETYGVQRLVNDAAKDVEVERWKKGDLTGQKVIAIPVDPKTTRGLTQQQIVFQLRSTLDDVRSLVDGKQSPYPQEQTEGLLKEGERLVEALKKISRAK